jgi:hypothetical protein
MMKPTIALTSLCIISTVIFGSATASFSNPQAKLDKLEAIIANTPCDENGVLVIGKAHYAKARIWREYRLYAKAADEMTRLATCVNKHDKRDKKVTRTILRERDRLINLEKSQMINNSGNQYNQSIIQGGKDAADSMTVPPDCGKLSTYDYNRYCK